MISICFQGKPFNITVIQAYALTSNAEEGEVEQFYEKLQDLLEVTPKKDVLFIIGDWNAKVGSPETRGVSPLSPPEPCSSRSLEVGLLLSAAAPTLSQPGTLLIQACVPTSNAEEAQVERFYEDLQDLLELTPKKDVLFIIGDWNAKVGSQETPGVTGRFGLGVQNEAGQRLIDF